MAFIEDLDSFLNIEDFGEVFEWNEIEFHAIFDNQIYTVEGEASVAVDLQQPSLTIKTSDADRWTQGDRVYQVSTGLEYIVQEIAPDGTGMSRVRLSAPVGSAAARKDALFRDRNPRGGSG